MTPPGTDSLHGRCNAAYLTSTSTSSSLLEHALELQLQLVGEADVLGGSRGGRGRGGGGGRDRSTDVGSGLLVLVLVLEARLDVGGAAAPHVPVLLGRGPRRLVRDHLPVGARQRRLARIDDVAAACSVICALV